MALIRVSVNNKVIPPFQREGKYRDKWKCELVPKQGRNSNKICISCAPRKEIEGR